MLHSLQNTLYHIVGQESWYYFRILTFVFLIAALFGAMNAALVDPEHSDTIVAALQDQLAFLSDFETWQLFLFVFFNNMIKAYVAMITGVIIGIIPVIFIILNGTVIGVIATVMLQRIGAFAVIAGLLPHGIIEIPAVLIAAAYGVYLGERAMKYIRHKEPIAPAFRSVHYRFGVYVIPLLLIAAFIEFGITAPIMDALR